MQRQRPAGAGLGPPASTTRGHQCGWRKRARVGARLADTSAEPANCAASMRVRNSATGEPAPSLQLEPQADKIDDASQASSRRQQLNSNDTLVRKRQTAKVEEFSASNLLPRATTRQHKAGSRGRPKRPGGEPLASFAWTRGALRMIGTIALICLTTSHFASRRAACSPQVLKSNGLGAANQVATTPSGPAAGKLIAIAPKANKCPSHLVGSRGISILNSSERPRLWPAGASCGSVA